MKCRFFKAVQVSNPLFDKAVYERHVREQAKLPADAERTPYPHQPTMEADAGYELEHPNCWVHCCPGLMNAEPIAEPADEECREKVVSWLQNTRPEKLAQLKNLYEQRHKFKDAGVVENIEKQAIAYGIAPGTADQNADLGKQVEKSSAKSAAKSPAKDSPTFGEPVAK